MTRRDKYIYIYTYEIIANMYGHMMNLKNTYGNIDKYKEHVWKGKEL